MVDKKYIGLGKVEDLAKFYEFQGFGDKPNKGTWNEILGYFDGNKINGTYRFTDPYINENTIAVKMDTLKDDPRSYVYIENTESVKDDKKTFIKDVFFPVKESLPVKELNILLEYMFNRYGINRLYTDEEAKEQGYFIDNI